MMFEELIPELRPFAQQLLDLAARAGVGFTITSTRRSHQKQASLYRAFLRGETHYPVAPPGSSAHEFGFAFDGVSEPFDYQADFGEVWKSWGGVWHAKDEVHFEFPGFSPPVQDKGLLQNAWDFLFVNAPPRAASFDDACAVVDFMKGSWAAQLLELGFGQNEILDFLSSPCGSVVKQARALGLPLP